MKYSSAQKTEEINGLGIYFQLISDFIVIFHLFSSLLWIVKTRVCKVFIQILGCQV